MITKSGSEILKEMEDLHFHSNNAWKSPSEWIETNGLGGWASSSVAGCNTRRYHGLLIAATRPPVGRVSLVSKLEEAITTENGTFELGTNDYGDVIYPHGYDYITSFTKDLFPEWTYQINGIVLKKTITMVQGENTTLVLYEVKSAPFSFILNLSPLISARDYHALQNSSTHIFWNAEFKDSVFSTVPYEGAPRIFILVPGAIYQHHPQWYYHFNYAVEKYRGLDFVEDLFNYGTFRVKLKEGDKAGIIISTKNPEAGDAFALFEKERVRKQFLINKTNDETTRQLTLAADQFIVKRDEHLKTIIAGYHWFTDWGRDTMISLPGLCLSTGRFEDAKFIISAFARWVSEGMLPNRFPDNGGSPEYNNVDGTLWYFIAIKRYLDATHDTVFLVNEILPVLKGIIDWHFKGTRYHIHVDDDNLLYAGEDGQQLTWMDVRIGDWVVTPRAGKPVEVQALWYNALNIFAVLLQLNHEEDEAARIRVHVEKTKESFLDTFWFKEGHYLYDVIDKKDIPDTTLRPNQLFAMSLPYPLIEGERAKMVLKIIEEKLYTTVGLRSLAANDTRYVPVYGGNPFQRDSSYHQGTVWSWLLGPYIDSIMKTPDFAGEDGLSGKEKAQKIIHDFAFHLSDGCIGSVSEIFDAEAPHYPRGCVAQAWSVGELLRVIREYKLEE